MMKVLLPHLPGLLLRMSGTLLRFKRDAKKAGRLFQQTLRAEGLDEKTAEELTSVYLENSNIFRFFEFFK